MHRDAPRARPLVASAALAAALALAVLAASALAWRAGALGSSRAPARAAEPAPEAVPAEELPGIAVIELFTSQGCSSCPPADRLLSEIAADPRLRGRVFPLSFHVDYWNRLGWRDPFSSPRWSARQQSYAERLDSHVYTPQVVVNGRGECVGSRRGEVLGIVERALATPPAVAIELSVTGGGASSGGLVAAVTARWRAAGGAAGAVPERAYVWAALWQDGRRTEVPRGENAGRNLANDRVVRRLEKVGELAAGAAAASGRVRLDVDPQWDGGGLGVVAFVQDPDSLAILGAAARRPSRQPGR